MKLRLTTHDPLPYRIRTSEGVVEFDSPDHTPEVITLACKAALFDKMFPDALEPEQVPDVEYYDFDMDEWVVLPR